MARSDEEVYAEVMTFRLSATLKAALAEIAREEEKPVGELLRDLIRRRVKDKKRREFEAEARRQCRLLNEAAKDPDSDEAQVMRELDANFDEFARDLAAREEAAEKRNAQKRR